LSVRNRNEGRSIALGRAVSRGFSIAVGIVIGALAAVIGSRVRDLDPSADARRADLEKRVRALELGSAPKSAARAIAPPEVQAKLHRELHAARIARHDREPIDPEWSPATTQRITSELDRAAAELQCKVTRIDCRTASCVVAFEWPSRHAALPAANELVHALADLPCTREVLFDDEAGPSGTIGGSMVLECDRSTPSSAR
jgi:hypothetical protein